MTATLNQKRAVRRPTRAFTFIELLISMLVIGLIVVAVYSAITSGMGNLRMARENLRATQVLLAKVEAIRLYTWEQLNSSFLPSTFVVPYNATATSTNAGALYYGTLSITPADLDTSYSDDMRLVTVQIRWKTGRINRFREIRTYVCRSGIQNYVY